MRKYETKKDLTDEIQKRAALFIDEFSDVQDDQKDILIEGVDRTPAQMIAYQLGWLNFVLDWEAREQQGLVVQTPSEDFKWNNLGGLYKQFYDTYQDLTLAQLAAEYNAAVDRVTAFVDSLPEDELFEPGGRRWAASTPANWPVWKWVHINTVAPFQTFKAKIRKWKRLASDL